MYLLKKKIIRSIKFNKNFQFHFAWSQNFNISICLCTYVKTYEQIASKQKGKSYFQTQSFASN